MLTIHELFRDLRQESLKWAHYLDIYDRHLAHLREQSVQGRCINILEIGVRKGGSLELWTKYFPNSRVFGIDCDRSCKGLESQLAHVKVFLGDQEDPVFLQACIEQVKQPLDVVVDDGGHRMKQQITSFENLYPSMSADGVYFCEDLHTSYWKEYGGGRGQKSTFVERSKNLIDELHACWGDRPTMEPTLADSAFFRCTDSVHFYDSIVCFERKSGTAAAPTLL